MRTFEEGDEVILDGMHAGRVIEVFTDRTPREYRVFITAMAKPVVLGSRLAPIRKARDGSERPWDLPPQSIRDLRFEITRQRLIGRLSDTLLSYGSARIDIQAHQFKPLLRLMDSPYRRLLIADEVGLGKTIEAGIIMSEFELREQIDRVLVVCPNALLYKWQQELEAKFGFGFRRWSASDVRAWLEREASGGGRGPMRAIASHSSFADAEIVAALRSANPALDLLVVDEAHHLRNRGTQLFKAGELLAANAELVLFLSATPLHLGNRDLFNLLHLLLPEVFNDERTFEDQLLPNKWLNEANRGLKAGATNTEVRSLLLNVFQTRFATAFGGSGQFAEMLDRLSKNEPLEREERVRFQRTCTELNTLGSVLTRTRKSEVQAFTVRSPHAVVLTFSPAERAFHDAVTQLFSERLAGCGTRFGAQMYQRQLCSSIPAVRAMLAGSLLAAERGNGRFAHDSEDDDGESGGVAVFPLDGLRRVLSLGRLVGARDSKFEELLRILGMHLSDSGGGRVVIFSFFRRTLDYLEVQLRHLFRVAQLRGGIELNAREAIIGRFRRGDVQILLSSEVGGEGLDFQFCNVLVNYDLPWNPMQVEQRIGRLDRFGQKSERIHIYNLLVEETVEARIFGRLFERLDLFRAAIGDVDAILGDVVRSFTDIALDATLTPEQQQEKADKLADQVLHLKAHGDQIAADRYALMSGDQYLMDRFESARFGRAHITGHELQTFMEVGLGRYFPTSRLVETDEGRELRPDRTFAGYVKQKVYGLGSGGQAHGDFVIGPLLRLWSACDAGSAIPVTFDPSHAFAERNLELLGPRHPFVRALASKASEEGQDPTIAPAFVRTTSSRDISSGAYLLAIHLVELKGELEERRMACTLVALSGAEVRGLATQELLHLLAEAEDGYDEIMVPEDASMERAFEVADSFVREGLARDTERLGARQRDFRELGLGAKRIRLERRLQSAERLARTVESKSVRQMHTGEAARLRRRLAALEEVGRGEHRLDVAVRQIGWAIVEVR